MQTKKVSDSFILWTFIAADVAFYYGNDQIIEFPIYHLSLLIKVSCSQ